MYVAGREGVNGDSRRDEERDRFVRLFRDVPRKGVGRSTEGLYERRIGAVKDYPALRLGCLVVPQGSENPQKENGLMPGTDLVCHRKDWKSRTGDPW